MSTATMFEYRPGLSLIDFFAVYGRAGPARDQVRWAGGTDEGQSLFPREPGPTWLHVVPRPASGFRRHRKRPPIFVSSAWRATKSRDASCPIASRLAESPEDSCVHCHMPRFKKTDIIHTATTDHRILRTPLPEET